MHFKPAKTKYFTFTKLNPFVEDTEFLVALAKAKGCFVTYYIEWIDEKNYVLEGLIIWHRRFTIWEAASRLESFNIGIAKDWEEHMEVIHKHREVHTLNYHPFCEVKTVLFEEGSQNENGGVTKIETFFGTPKA